jgi:hypothetical protein
MPKVTGQNAVPKNQLYRWHFTIAKVITNEDGTETTISSNDVKKFCRMHAKRWVFQEEEGATNGFRHYQVKVSLKLKSRFNQVRKWLQDFNLGKPHLSPEMTDNDQDGFNYVMKDDSRKDGPWTDKTDRVYVPPSWTLAHLLPWQQEAWNLVDNQNDRQILFVVDPIGGTGKSSFFRHIIASQVGFIVPPLVTTGLQIVQWVTGELKDRDAKRHWWIVCDLPRAATRNPMMWDSLIPALELIKNGIAYDTRYSNTQVWYEYPKMIVFVNQLPPGDYLTGDRIKVLDPMNFANTPGALPPPAAVDPLSEEEEEEHGAQAGPANVVDLTATSEEEEDELFDEMDDGNFEALCEAVDTAVEEPSGATRSTGTRNSPTAVSPLTNSTMTTAPATGAVRRPSTASAALAADTRMSQDQGRDEQRESKCCERTQVFWSK